MLGNDVEDEDTAPAPLPREIVKSSTSSKKADVPPASADPAKARKNKKTVTGNDAALKNKNDNKNVSAPSATPTKHQKKPFDRHSRTGKTDSKKKVKQAWGDSKGELDDEASAAKDAGADLEAEASENSTAAAGAKSLKEYYEELAKANAQLGSRSVAANANSEPSTWEGQIVRKEQSSFFEGTSVKNIKQKATKEKKTLDFQAVFADEARTPFNRDGASKPTRGGAKPRGGKAPAGKKASGPEVNDKNFPSL